MSNYRDVYKKIKKYIIVIKNLLHNIKNSKTIINIIENKYMHFNFTNRFLKITFIIY